MRLWYGYSTGVHGFTRDEVKAERAYNRIKNVLNTDDIQVLKTEVINLYNSEVVAKVVHGTSVNCTALTSDGQCDITKSTAGEDRGTSEGNGSTPRHRPAAITTSLA